MTVARPRRLAWDQPAPADFLESVMTESERPATGNDLSEPGPIRGSSWRCEYQFKVGGSGGGLCGERAAWWDGSRLLCKEHADAQ